MLLTFTAFEGITELLAGADTLIGIFATQDAPPLPQDLMCSVCPPFPADTCLLIDVPLMTVVSGLLSNEKPIEPTACEEHVGALATTSNGEETCALLPGLLTSMPSVD